MSTDRDRIRRLVEATELVPFAEIERMRTRAARTPRGLPAVATALVTVLAVVAAAVLFVRADPGAFVVRPSGITPAPSVASSPEAYGPSVERVYERVAGALARPGLVYHATIDGGPGGRREIWVDARRDVAREEPNVYREGVAITSGGGSYSRVAERQSHRCYGANTTTSLLLTCPFPGEKESRAEVEHGSYDARSAIVLVRGGKYSSGEWPASYTQRVYLDSETFLPIAREFESLVEAGERSERNSIHERYRHEFIAVGSLPDGFFDPSSINGAREPDEGLLDRGWTVPVYWLGRRYEGEAGLPPLVLHQVEAAPQGDPYEFELEYRLVGRTYEPVRITLQELRPAIARRLLRPLGGYCPKQEEVPLPTGRAIIYSAYSYDEGGPLPVPAKAERECRGKPSNRLVAHVDLGPAVVVVRAIADGQEPNPYATVRGLKSIVRALREREPTQ